MVSEKKRALFFGVKPGDRAGHFLWGCRNGYSLDGKRDAPGFPWDMGLVDGGLLKNWKVPDWPDGRVHWTCGGTPIWIAFVWWDRSEDKRGACNSGFYVQGFDPRTELRQAFEFACGEWPLVVARQEHPLKLVEVPA